MGWDAAQEYWREQFAERGWTGVRLLAGVYYLRRREAGEVVRLSDEGVFPSKLAWLVQQGFAEGVE